MGRRIESKNISWNNDIIFSERNIFDSFSLMTVMRKYTFILRDIFGTQQFKYMINVIKTKKSFRNFQIINQTH